MTTTLQINELEEEMVFLTETIFLLTSWRVMFFLYFASII